MHCPHCKKNAEPLKLLISVRGYKCAKCGNKSDVSDGVYPLGAGGAAAGLVIASASDGLVTILLLIVLVAALLSLELYLLKLEPRKTEK